MSSKIRTKQKSKKPLPKTGKPEPFSARTQTQQEYIRAIVENQVIYCTGPSGTGKSAVAIAMASQFLLRGEYNSIIITRPCVEVSKKSLGALPGGLKDKFDPYLKSVKKELKKFLGEMNFMKYSAEGNIEFLPLEYMRGETFDNSIMLLDEAQNADFEQLKMFITRIGENSKILINGDADQSDLKKFTKSDRESDLEYIIRKTSSLRNFSHIEFTTKDIVRNPLIESFLNSLKE